MNNYLKTILQQKRIEVTALKKSLINNPKSRIAQIHHKEIKNKNNKSFKQSLQSNNIAIIGEIKRKSPSKGKLATIANPVALAEQYYLAGVDAISILTDTAGFNGSIDDLKNVANSLVNTTVTILRKDFIIDEIQIAEAIVNGAHAVLLITSIVKDNLAKLLRYCRERQIDALVEVHNYDELQQAIAAKADIIGVNNRDLTNFTVNTNNAIKLKPYIPEHIITVAESGIQSLSLAKKYAEVGYDALLIGEALVTSAHPQTFINEIKTA